MTDEEDDRRVRSDLFHAGRKTLGVTIRVLSAALEQMERMFRIGEEGEERTDYKGILRFKECDNEIGLLCHKYLRTCPETLQNWLENVQYFFRKSIRG